MPSDRLPGLPAAACEPPAGEEAPFLRHHRVARALVDTFQEALQPQLSTRGVLTREEFDRAVALMTAQWPRTLPLFARACQGCGLAGGMAEAGRDEEARPDAFRPDGRRRDFVTRLVFSSVLLKLPESVDPVSGAVFPKLLAPGLQATLSGLFFEKEWEAMNGDAIALYTQIGSDRDAVVWQRIARQQALAVLADAMFVRVMLRFRQFHLQRQTVVRRMIDRLRNGASSSPTSISTCCSRRCSAGCAARWAASSTGRGSTCATARARRRR
ncbi:hypothetical protein [Azospirillum thermophilum]|uniref:hypothetical protein n=1 Tax=Azospirillum thermophilum TaxID=2202148 RepID=UPI001FE919C0|nr:hypothetical protein [Azospirillum thermophilum]